MMPNRRSRENSFLELASLLWRLRRATAIETGLFRIHAQHLLDFRRGRQSHEERQKIIDSMYQNAISTGDGTRKKGNDQLTDGFDSDSEPTVETADQSDDLTRSFVRLTNLPTYPLDRSRYEATLWRQACQILLTLRCLNSGRRWERLRSGRYRLGSGRAAPKTFVLVWRNRTLNSRAAYRR